MGYVTDFNGEEITNNVTVFQIFEKIDWMKKDEYIIISSTEENYQMKFIQFRKRKENFYDTEIRLEEENNFEQYQKELSKKELLDAINNYYANSMPSISKWTNITKYLKSYYFDQEERLTPTSVHPIFSESFTEAFYYSTEDYFSPFGNDSGFDMLNDVEEFIKEKEENIYYVRTLFPEEITYHITTENIHLVNHALQQIVSAGFCTIKVDGIIMDDMKQEVLVALSVLQKLYKSENYKTMIDDFKKITSMSYAT